MAFLIDFDNSDGFGHILRHIMRPSLYRPLNISYADPRATNHRQLGENMALGGSKKSLLTN